LIKEGSESRTQAITDIILTENLKGKLH
jgi:hypothetical protein